MKNLFLTLSILIINNIYCQEINTSWSPLQEYNGDLDQPIGIDKGGFNYYKRIGEERLLTLCNKDLSEYITCTIPPNFVEKRYTGQIEDIFKFEGSLYAGLSKMDFKERWSYNIYKINIGDELKITASDHKEIYSCPWGASTNLAKFYVKKSDDLSKTVVLTEHPIEKKKQSTTIGISVLEGTKVISSSTYDLNFPSRKWTSYEVKLDNAGNILIHTKFKNFEKKWQTTYWYLPATTTDLQEIVLKENQRIDQIEPTIDPSGNAQITGTIKETIKGEQDYKVLSIFNINVKGNKLEEIKLIPLTDAIFKDYYSKTTLTELGRSINNLLLKKIHYTETGDKILLLERYSSKKELIPPAEVVNNQKHKYYHDCGKIVAICLTKDASTIKWHSIINKRQQKMGYTPNSDHISFISHYTNNQLYILYNDIPKEPMTAADRHKNQLYPISLVVLNEKDNSEVNPIKKGKHQSQFFSLSASSPLFLRTSPVLNVDDNSIVVCASTRNEKYLSFGLVRF